jgi:glycosyltransferase involved in cell wall biosynthesis
MNRAGAASSPIVTVLMPVYNGQAFLEQAIDSILEQTLSDFELLIIDDGSTDGSPEIIAGYDDRRLRVVRNERNIRLVGALNRGLALARGRYLARMDSDDISLPTRLERQVGFLESNPEIGACGSWVATIGDGNGSVWKYAEGAEEIRCRLLFSSALAHSTVCMRRDWFARNGLQFDEAYPHAEDYELWRRASEKFPLANIPEILVRYRIHEASVSRRQREIQDETVRRIHREGLSRLGLDPSDEELSLHRWIALGGRAGEALPLAETGIWLEKLLRANDERKIYPCSALGQLLGQYWLASAYRALAVGQPAVVRFLRSALARRIDLDQRARLVAHAAKRAVGLGSRSAALQR